MSILAWIIVTSFAGGVISVSIAAGFSLAARARWIPMLISYAIGALLGAAFLDLLPDLIESGVKPAEAGAMLLGGILLFFFLEKLSLWRHCHHEHCEAHELPTLEHHHVHDETCAHDHAQSTQPYRYAPRKTSAEVAPITGATRRTGLLIVIGDSFHNFVDGVLIAAAFMQDIRLGLIAALAMFAHEIPQEVGDYLILLNSGYTKLRAWMLNVLSSFATLAGGLLAYMGLSAVKSAAAPMLALATASMIYVAVADLIPGLHQRTELRATVQQIVLILLGALSVYAAHHYIETHLGIG
ncbi:MAG TPA: ZIP family metal transporter [Rhodocyclaceae bacterium]|nr:ZIP family metal transporter [Rhodocyclaceae bacterium]